MHWYFIALVHEVLLKTKSINPEAALANVITVIDIRILFDETPIATEDLIFVGPITKFITIEHFCYNVVQEKVMDGFGIRNV